MSSVPEILKGGQKIIDKAVKNEWRNQGHYLTGNLERSLQAKVSSNTLEGQGLDYWEKLETGVPKSKIQINDTTLNEMKGYVELRMGYKGKKALQVAYNILKKQSQEGMPTKASSRFSKTGKRKGAIGIGFKSVESELDNYILGGIDKIINENFGRQKNEVI